MNDRNNPKIFDFFKDDPAKALLLRLGFKSEEEMEPFVETAQELIEEVNGKERDTSLSSLYNEYDEMDLCPRQKIGHVNNIKSQDLIDFFADKAFREFQEKLMFSSKSFKSEDHTFKEFHEQIAMYMQNNQKFTMTVSEIKNLFKKNPQLAILCADYSPLLQKKENGECEFKNSQVMAYFAAKNIYKSLTKGI